MRAGAGKTPNPEDGRAERPADRTYLLQPGSIELGALPDGGLMIVIPRAGERAYIHWMAQGPSGCSPDHISHCRFDVIKFLATWPVMQPTPERGAQPTVLMVRDEYRIMSTHDRQFWMDTPYDVAFGTLAEVVATQERQQRKRLEEMCDQVQAALRDSADATWDEERVERELTRMRHNGAGEILIEHCRAITIQRWREEARRATADRIERAQPEDEWSAGGPGSKNDTPSCVARRGAAGSSTSSSGRCATTRRTRLTPRIQRAAHLLTPRVVWAALGRVLMAVTMTPLMRVTMARARTPVGA